MVAEMPADLLEFSYDHSRFQETPEIILSAVFRFQSGADPARLRDVARGSLAHRKRTQPLHLPSAGCAFQNPDRVRDRVPPEMPASAGALVDAAGLKGRAIGGARVSSTHANFIVSDGTATAADIRALVRLCQAEVHRQFGVDLTEEIRWIGFGD
jgi:UDP-N-acetylmuramate dehydrogenase